MPRVKYLAVVARTTYVLYNQNVWLSCIRVFCVTHDMCLLHICIAIRGVRCAIYDTTVVTT